MSISSKGVVKFGELSFNLDPKLDYVEVSVGKEKARLSHESLWSLAFTISSDPDLQDKLLPVRKTEMMEFDRLHSIMLKRDMKKGEILKTVCHVNVPQTIVDTILTSEIQKRKGFKA